MARNRTPSNILKLTGAYKKNPQRKRGEEPEGATFKKTAPTKMEPALKKIWRELIRDIAPGVLQQGDRILLEQTTILIGRMRENSDEFTASQHQTLISCLARLGMTPADRSKVVVPKVTRNKFDRAAG